VKVKIPTLSQKARQGWGTLNGNKEANQKRDYGVAKNATRHAARRIPSTSPRAGLRRAECPRLRMTTRKRLMTIAGENWGAEAPQSEATEALFSLT